MKTFLQYVSVAIALFGPKFGFIDSRILLIPIAFVFFNARSIAIPKNLLNSLGVLAFLLFYSFLLFLIFPSNPDYLRYFRSLLSLFCLMYIVGYKNNFESGLMILVNVLVLHPLAIYVSFFSPSIQTALAHAFYFTAEKSKNLVFSGLTAGFDMAGFLSTGGFLVCIYFFYYKRSVSLLINSVLFFVSVFFTSRTSIVILLFFSTYLFFEIIFRSKVSQKNKLFGGLIFTTLLIVSYKFVLPNFIATIDIEIFDSISDKGNEDAIFIYAKTDPFQMLNSFIILPKTTLGIFFGENIFPSSDSGYIQTINAIGVFGLAISFYFYFRLYRSMKRLVFSSRLQKNISKVFKMILFITIFVNIKNQYLFTRGSFELIILLFLILNLPLNRTVVTRDG